MTASYNTQPWPEGQPRFVAPEVQLAADHAIPPLEITADCPGCGRPSRLTFIDGGLCLECTEARQAERLSRPLTWRHPLRALLDTLGLLLDPTFYPGGGRR